MIIENRPCLVHQTECRFLHWGLGIDYPDGKTPAVITKAFVEHPDGRVIEVYPTNVCFVNKTPEPLADDPGETTTQP